MGQRRVVVSGVGVVSALGNGRDEFWSALASGRSGIAPLTSVERTGLGFDQLAEARAFDPAAVLDPKLIDRTDRFAQFALAAALEALADAQLTRASLSQQTSGVITGCSIGGQSTQDAGFFSLYREGRSRLHPLTIPRVMPNTAASCISIELGIHGPSYAVSAACSSSNFAIGQAFWLVRSGVLDVALAGGSEAPFSLGYLKAWDALRVVSRDTCRPFSAGRSGMILGEGGGMLVLENSETARARGAKIYAEVIGFGMSSDANHLVEPSAAGAAASIRASLADAGVVAQDVDYINAHGSGTLANDSTETSAIHIVFAEHAANLAVSSTKSMHGHALGAAGALEAIATVMAIEHQIAPPTANYLGADPACDLDYVPNTARHCEIDVAISHSFAFGGANAVLAFRRWTP
jgi:nodulation protein E